LGTGQAGDLLIFDVGANRGQRTDVFLRLGARVVAVDPDAANQRLLSRKYHGRPVTIVGKAVSDSEREETLRTTSPGSGLNTLSDKWVRTLADKPSKLGARVGYPLSQKVEATTLARLMEAHGVPRYIKVDVEGHELHVLRGLGRPVPFVSFEAILPEFAPETAECIRILNGLSAGGCFNYSKDCYKGTCLEKWVTAEEITQILTGLGEITVEVFWRSK
jgi:FkbM family methyltransferase